MLIVMYSNKGDKLMSMPRVLSLREQIDAAARGAIVMTDMSRKNDGITEWLLPENVRGITSAELFQMQNDAKRKIESTKSKFINEY